MRYDRFGCRWSLAAADAPRPLFFRCIYSEWAPRRRFGEEEDSRRSPPLVQAAFDNLRDVALKRLRENPDSETRIVEVLARAAGDLRKE
jgi:hypothetical protein